MKRLSIIILVLVICLGSFLVYVIYRVNHGNIFSHGLSIRISDNDHRYEFSARYPTDLTGKLRQYVGSRLRTDFFNQEHINEDVTLDDDTRIFVWNTPGRLVIRLVKEENSPQAYARLKELSTALKDRLSD
jgi:hypothetical protein